MIKPIKFKTSDNPNIFFTSDQHYNHNPNWSCDPLWKTRGFNSIDEHDEWMRSEYSKLPENSIVFSLGDPALNSTPEKLMNLFRLTDANIFHIWGNHYGNDYRIYKNAMNFFNDRNADDPLFTEEYPINIDKVNYDFDVRLGVPELKNRICFLGYQQDIQIDKLLIHLVHMPPRIWTRRAVCLHGHCHSKLSGSQPEDKSHGQILDVGVDNSLKYNKTAFFKHEDIIRIMNNKPQKTEDHA